MKQIGLALHNYISSNDCVPPGNLPSRNTTSLATRSNGDFSAHARLLGFMEQQQLYNAANFSVSCFNDNTGEAINSTATTARLNVFLCPSATYPSWNVVSLSVARLAPGNSYFASLGSTIEFAGNQTNQPPNGVFMYNANGLSIGIRDISDGTSNTIAFGEWKIGSGSVSILAPGADIVFQGTFPPGATRNVSGMNMPGNGAGLLTWAQQCAAKYKSTAPASRGNSAVKQGMGWAYGLIGITMGTAALPPNSRFPNCSTNGANTLEAPGMMNMASFHPGGANAVMCDGSVKFLKDSTNNQVIWSLGSRAQGEVISSDSY